MREVDKGSVKIRERDKWRERDRERERDSMREKQVEGSETETEKWKRK